MTSIEKHSNREAVAKRSDDPEQMTLGDALYSRREALVKIAAEFVDVDRLFELAVFTVGKNSSLARCTHVSVIRACYDSARLGLTMDGVEAAMVPFKNVATCQPMYQGLVKLAYEEPTLSGIDARIIREGDEFDIVEGTSPRIHHKPNLRDAKAERKPGIIWYAVAQIRGRAKFDYMTWAQIDALRKRSPAVRAGMSSPWDTDYDEMGKARIIKRLCKTLPKRPRLTAAIDHDNALEGSVVDASVISSSATATAALGLGREIAGALPAVDRSADSLSDAELREEISKAYDALEIPREKRKAETRVWLGHAVGSVADARMLLGMLREAIEDRRQRAALTPQEVIDDEPEAESDPPPGETDVR